MSYKTAIQQHVVGLRTHRHPGSGSREDSIHYDRGDDWGGQPGESAVTFEVTVWDTAIDDYKRVAIFQTAEEALAQADLNPKLRVDRLVDGQPVERLAGK